MNVAAARTELVTTQALTGEIVFAPGGVDKLIEQVRAEVAAFKPDMSTKAGREAIASFAYKVARSKTAIDKLGKDLAADLKAKTSAIDAERRRAWNEMEKLQAQVRQPLDEWEAKEAARVAEHEDFLKLIENAASCAVNDQRLEIVDKGLAFLAGDALTRDWQEFKARADEAMSKARSTLTNLRDEVINREAERVELERLRREQAEREQKERDERIAREAADRARQEAETKAAREAAAAAEREAAEQRRLVQEREAAEARARQAEADRIAAEEKAARAADEAIAAERRRAADEQARRAAADKQREEDKKHRAAIHQEILTVLCEPNGPLTLDHGKEVVVLIATRKVPHVSISY